MFLDLSILSVYKLQYQCVEYMSQERELYFICHIYGIKSIPHIQIPFSFIFFTPMKQRYVWIQFVSILFRIKTVILSAFVRLRVTMKVLIPVQLTWLACLWWFIWVVRPCSNYTVFVRSCARQEGGRVRR